MKTFYFQDKKTKKIIKLKGNSQDDAINRQIRREIRGEAKSSYYTKPKKQIKKRRQSNPYGFGFNFKIPKFKI